MATIHIYPTANPADDANSNWKVQRVALYGTTGAATPHELAIAPLTLANGDLPAGEYAGAQAGDIIMMHHDTEATPGSKSGTGTQQDWLMSEGNQKDYWSELNVKLCTDGGPVFDYFDFSWNYTSGYIVPITNTVRRALLLRKEVTILGEVDNQGNPITVVTKAPDEDLPTIISENYVTLRNIYFKEMIQHITSLVAHPCDIDNCKFTVTPTTNPDYRPWATPAMNVSIPEQVTFYGKKATEVVNSGGNLNSKSYITSIRNCEFVNVADSCIEVSGSCVEVTDNVIRLENGYTVTDPSGTYSWKEMFFAFGQWSLEENSTFGIASFHCYQNKFERNKVQRSPDGESYWFFCTTANAAPYWYGNVANFSIKDNEFDVNRIGNFTRGQSLNMEVSGNTYNQSNSKYFYVTAYQNQAPFFPAKNAAFSDNKIAGEGNAVFAYGYDGLTVGNNDYSASTLGGISVDDAMIVLMDVPDATISRNARVFEVPSYAGWGGVAEVPEFIVDETLLHMTMVPQLTNSSYRRPTNPSATAAQLVPLARPNNHITSIPAGMSKHEAMKRGLLKKFSE